MRADGVLTLSGHAQLAFGPGAVNRIGEAVIGLGRDRVCLVPDSGLVRTGIVDRVEGLLRAAGLTTCVFSAVEPNPSTATIDLAAAQARVFGDAVVVAVGGGSALDAAKGIALFATNPGLNASDHLNAHLAAHLAAGPTLPGLPVVAVPTTSGTGAETNGFGVIEDRTARRKVYIGNDSVRPVLALLDPELTLGLPAAVTAATGMDALVHGIESLASRGGNPLSIAYAAEAVSLVSGHLARAVEDGSDLEARSALMIGSHLAGLALSLSGLGLVHGLAHAITNHTGAAHGLALSAVLDDVMTRSLDVAGPAYAKVARAMGLDTHGDDAPVAAVEAVRELADRVGARRPLSDLGMRPAQVPAVAAGALEDAVTRNHPRAFDESEVEQILAANL